MEIVAVLFLTGLVVGYFVLAGCDIGLGMLMPYVARTPGERRRLVRAIAPYFLGTEVWLVGAIGVIAGLFPALKSEIVAGLWPVFTAILAGWLWRDAGLWLRARVDTAAWRGAWDAAITAGSWTLALGWGLVVGGLLSGGPPLSPFAIACALTVVLLFALRGAAFGAERLVPVNEPPEGGAPVSAGPIVSPSSGSTPLAAPAEHARPAVNIAESADVAAQATRILARGASAGLVVTVIVAVLPGGSVPDRPLGALAAVALLAASLVATAGLWGPRLSRHTSALAVAAAPLAVAAAVELPIATAPSGTLTLVGTALAPLIPVMLLGQVWLYRMLRRPPVLPGFFG